MATTDCVDRVLEQIHLWEEAHERGDPELCAWLRLQYAELLWDDAQGIYEGHEEVRQKRPFTNTVLTET